MTIRPMNVRIDWKTDKLSDYDLSECIYLEIWHHTSKNFDFTNLPDAPNLKKIFIDSSNVKNLNGLDKYPFLEEVDMYYLRNLESLDGIEKMSQRIRFFSIESARKLTDITPVTKLKNIEGLGFINIGDIDNLEFLYDMYELKSLSFVGTKIICGDLAPVINHFNIKCVGFDNRRHYSHKSKEVDLLLLKKEIMHQVILNEHSNQECK